MSKAKKEVKPKPGKATRIIPTGITHIVALDLSLNSTGWATCLIDSNEVKWGALVNATDATKLVDIERLDWISTEVRKLIAGGQPSQTLVAIEGFSFGSANKAAEIGMLHGVIRYGLYKAGIHSLIIAPTQMKKWVIGKSIAEKSLILKYIEKRYGYDCDQEDVADALGLMTLARAFLGRHQGELVAFQREVLAGLMNPKT